MALSLNSNTTAPTVSLNTSKLQQGLAINLSKENGALKRAAVKISWVGEDVDLDINAVGFGADGKALLEPITVMYKGRESVVPKDLIFYQNLEQQGIKHGGDVVSSGDVEEEQILVAVQDLSDKVHKIEFIVTSHVESGTALLLADAGAMTASLIDLDTNEVLYTTELDSNAVRNQSAAVFANLSKNGKGEWSYQAQMQGYGAHAHGVQGILDSCYG